MENISESVSKSNKSKGVKKFAHILHGNTLQTYCKRNLTEIYADLKDNFILAKDDICPVCAREFVKEREERGDV